MFRSLVLLAFAAAIAGCATETRVVRDNSATAKFAAMFGGKADTSDGGVSGGAWTVVSQGGKSGPSNGPSGPVSPTAMKIAELLKNQANAPRPVLDRNPGNWKVTTSFPTDGQGTETAPPQNTPLNPTPDPWGTAPLAPALPGSVMPAVPTDNSSR